MVSIALIDDHALVREALAGMIADIGGYRVVLQGGTGQEYVDAMQHAPPPEVAIVDLHMPFLGTLVESGFQLLGDLLDQLGEGSGEDPVLFHQITSASIIAQHDLLIARHHRMKVTAYRILTEVGLQEQIAVGIILGMAQLQGAGHG